MGETNDYTFKSTVALAVGDLKACAVDENPTKITCFIVVGGQVWHCT